MTAAQDPLIGKRLGRFQIDALLGRGQGATVYRATDTVVGTATALKVLDQALQRDPAVVAAFLRDAEQLGRLSHPHILAIQEAAERDGHVYIARQFTDGGTLQGLLREVGTLPVPELLAVLRPVATALDYAHRQGYVHGNLRPANILRTKSGQIFLTDFVVPGKDQGARSAATTVISALDAPEYASPEQARVAVPTASGDRYVLGLIAYEALVGRLPFPPAARGENARAVLSRHLQAAPPAPSSLNPELGPALDATLLRALAKRPEERYPTGSALIHALGEAFEQGNARVAPSPKPRPLPVEPPRQAEPPRAEPPAPRPAAGRATPPVVPASAPVPAAPPPPTPETPPARASEPPPPIVVAASDAVGVVPAPPATPPASPPPLEESAVAATVSSPAATAAPTRRDAARPAAPVAAGPPVPPPARRAAPPWAAVIVGVFLLLGAVGLGGAFLSGRSGGTGATGEPTAPPAAVVGPTVVAADGPTATAPAATAALAASVAPSAAPSAVAVAPGAPAAQPTAAAPVAPSIAPSAAPAFSRQEVILFASQRGGAGAQIYAVGPDGKNARPLTSVPGTAWGPRIAPDGRSFSFASAAAGEDRSGVAGGLDGSGKHDIALLNPADPAPVGLVATPTWNSGWSWSPDGKALAFTSNRDGNWEIYLLRFPGNEVVRLTNNAAQDAWPAWTPDGQRIVFMSTRDGYPQLYSMGADGKGVERLNLSESSDTLPVVSPDGKRVAYTAESPETKESQIFVMDISGANSTRLTSVGTYNGQPAWSPDSSRIAFVSDRDGGRHIYTMRADGSAQTALTSGAGVDATPEWGTLVLPAARGAAAPSPALPAPFGLAGLAPLPWAARRRREA